MSIKLEIVRMGALNEKPDVVGILLYVLAGVCMVAMLLMMVLA